MKCKVLKPAGVNYAGEHYKKNDEVDILSGHVVTALLADKSIELVGKAPEPSTTPDKAPAKK